MSALPPIADIGTQSRNVRFVPKADIGGQSPKPETGLLNYRIVGLTDSFLRSNLAVHPSDLPFRRSVFPTRCFKRPIQNLELAYSMQTQKNPSQRRRISVLYGRNVPP